MKKNTTREYWDIIKYFILVGVVVVLIRSWIISGLKDTAILLALIFIVFSVIFTVVTIVVDIVKYHQKINREKREENE